MREININRQLLGIEDLLFGFGQVTQTRAGQSVNITKINAGNLPFDETQSLLQWIQNTNLAELGAMTVELQAIYDSIDALNNLENNLVVLNTLEQAINCLNNLCVNLTKLQNIDTNMPKLQNMDTNMPKLQNIDTNMTKLQNIDTNMLQLSSIYTNMTSLQNIYTNMSSITTLNANISSINTVSTNMSSVNNVSSNIAVLVNINSNMTNLNAINTQIIPHLSEILLVDDYAAQVSADKTTVANDKASVASMKLAVETIYDTFDDRFLGTKTSDPTLDNDGNPLLDGAMYFDTSAHVLKVYSLSNTTWYSIPQIYLSGLLDVTLTSITTGDLLTWNGSKWVNTRTPSFDSIKLNSGTGTSGTATWNNTEYTYDIVLNPNVTLQVGQEDLVYCKNNSASVIANGRPVMASGTNGNSGNILVDLHDGTKANARRIVGIATEDLTANGYGFVTRNGKVRGINTTGSQYGETWVNGDILYVKATGNLTNIEPADTALKMPIAFVIHAHTKGTLYIRTTGIDENHDRDFINNLVDIHSKTAKTTLADADEFMTADSTSSFSLKKITWASIKTLLTSLFIPRVTTPTINALAKIQDDGTIKNSSIIEDANGNIGIGGILKSWLPSWKAIQGGNGSLAIASANQGMYILNNAYYDASGVPKYASSGTASMIQQTGGGILFYTAPSGIADTTITWKNPMNLSTSGILSLAPSNTSGTQTALSLYDEGGGLGEGCAIAFSSSTYPDQCRIYASTQDLKINTAGSDRVVVTSTGTLQALTGGIYCYSPSNLIGYGTGAGGTVTQLTSKSTAVTLNKPSGQIIMNNSALAAGATAEFQFNNSLISSSDMVIASLSTSSYNVFTSVGYNGFCFIRIINNSGSSASSSLNVYFEIIKGAIA